MVYVLGIFAFVVAVIALIRVENLRGELDSLKARIAGLESGPAGSGMPRRSARAAPAEAPSVRSQVKDPVVTLKPAAEKIVPKKKRTLTAFERQFLDNWTGILGSVFVVLGVGFLAGYAAIKFSPEVRFALLSVLSAVFAAGWYLLRKREGWSRLGAWFKSISGAVLLFACLGAGNIKGLKFIDDQSVSVYVLTAGIAVNLLLGAAGRHQGFASFHTVLSIVALFAAPVIPQSFIAAAVISFIGVVMTYREKWELHLIAALSAFFAYHVYYFQSFTGGISGGNHLMGIICVVVVSVPAVFTHYRAIYAGKRFDVLAFAAHLLNWIYLGVGIVVHSVDFALKPYLLLAGAAVILLCARRARSSGVRWLFVSDSIMALVVACLAMLSFSSAGLGATAIIASVFALTIVFALVMLLEGESGLGQAGIWLTNSAAAVITVKLMQGNEQSVLNKNFAGVIICAAGVFVFNIFADRFFREKYTSYALPKVSPQNAAVFINGLIPAFFVLGMLTGISRTASWHYAGAVCILLFAVPALLFPAKGLTYGLIVLVALFDCFGFYFSPQGSAADSLVYALPFLLLPLSVSFIRGKGAEVFLQYITLSAFFVSLMVFSFHCITAVSPLVLGLFWLYCSMLALTAGSSVKQRADGRRASLSPAFLVWGNILLAAFIIRYCSADILSEKYVQVFGVDVQARVMLEAAVVCTLVYAAFFLKLKTPVQLFVRIAELYFEVLIGFAVLVIAVETAGVYQPLVWGAFSIVFLLAGQRCEGAFSRVRVYSLFLYLASALQTALYLSGKVSPSMRFADQVWFLGLVAIAIQIAYLILIRRVRFLEDIASAELLRFIPGLSAIAARRQNIIVYYVFFACMAVFLYNSFDRAVLTLLWVAEAFAVFMISIIHRDGHFRYLSFLALLACVLRIISFDMVQTDVFMKAIVFIGTGGIMLLMNTIYNKFKD
jgi:hypothetical protein